MGLTGIEVLGFKVRKHVVFSDHFRMTHACERTLFSRQRREKENLEPLVHFETKLGSYRNARGHKVQKQVKFSKPSKITHSRTSSFCARFPTIKNKISASAEGANGKNLDFRS